MISICFRRQVSHDSPRRGAAVATRAGAGVCARCCGSVVAVGGSEDGDVDSRRRPGGNEPQKTGCTAGAAAAAKDRQGKTRR